MGAVWSNGWAFCEDGSSGQHEGREDIVTSSPVIRQIPDELQIGAHGIMEHLVCGPGLAAPQLGQGGIGGVADVTLVELLSYRACPEPNARHMHASRVVHPHIVSCAAGPLPQPRASLISGQDRSTAWMISIAFSTAVAAFASVTCIWPP